MTGLLHRLAACASGTAWTVRSDARLPFGAGYLSEGGAVQDSHDPQVSWEVARGMEVPIDAPPSTPTAMPNMSSLARDPPSAMDAQPAGPPVLLQPTPVKTASASALTAGRVLQPYNTFDTTGVPAQLPTATQSGPEATAIHHPNWSATREDIAQPGLAPLLPPVRTDARLPSMVAPQQRATLRAMGVSQHTTSQDTEVHIHIGRIDVTAVHEKPQPKARARERERTQPVSLDAYLAARSSK